MVNKRALYGQTLQRAADKLGGVDQLSKKLKIRSQFITLWIRGKGIPPEYVFVRASDLLNAPSECPIASEPTGWIEAEQQA
jgi:hypothetical protein